MPYVHMTEEALHMLDCVLAKADDMYAAAEDNNRIAYEDNLSFDEKADAGLMLDIASTLLKLRNERDKPDGLFRIRCRVLGGYTYWTGKEWTSSHEDGYVLAKTYKTKAAAKGAITHHIHGNVGKWVEGKATTQQINWWGKSYVYLGGGND